MKKILKKISILIIWGCGIPAAAALPVMWLWNWIMPAVCGFSTVTYLQAAGLFLLGQFLSTGFIIGIFLLGGTIHHATHHSSHRLSDHWHKLSEEERKAFIASRRAMFEAHRKGFGFGRHNAGKTEENDD